GGSWRPRSPASRGTRPRPTASCRSTDAGPAAHRRGRTFGERLNVDDRAEPERRGEPREGVPLAPLSTMGVGGSARWYVEAGDEAAILGALDWAERRRLPTRILGGGSNLVVADAGVDGLIVHVALRGVAVRPVGENVELTAAAGEPWDDVVRLAVDR